MDQYTPADVATAPDQELPHPNDAAGRKRKKKSKKGDAGTATADGTAAKEKKPKREKAPDVAPARIDQTNVVSLLTEFKEHKDFIAARMAENKPKRNRMKSIMLGMDQFRQANPDLEDQEILDVCDGK